MCKHDKSKIHTYTYSQGPYIQRSTPPRLKHTNPCTNNSQLLPPFEFLLNLHERGLQHIPCDLLHTFNTSRNRNGHTYPHYYNTRRKTAAQTHKPIPPFPLSNHPHSYRLHATEDGCTTSLALLWWLPRCCIQFGATMRAKL